MLCGRSVETPTIYIVDKIAWDQGVRWASWAPPAAYFVPVISSAGSGLGYAGCEVGVASARGGQVGSMGSLKASLTCDILLTGSCSTKKSSFLSCSPLHPPPSTVSGVCQSGREYNPRLDSDMSIERGLHCRPERCPYRIPLWRVIYSTRLDHGVIIERVLYFRPQ